MEDTCDKALNQALANTLILVENWARLDLSRQEGIITAEDQVKIHSDYVHIIGTALMQLLEKFPLVSDEVINMYQKQNNTIQNLILEGFGH